MAERFKAPVLKTGEGSNLPWVRIPLSPPSIQKAPEIWGFFLVTSFHFWIVAVRALAAILPSEESSEQYRTTPQAFVDLHQIKPICVHHFVPCGDEVTDEFFVVVVLGVDLGVGAQH